MKNSWLVWFFIVGVGVTVLIAFNYQGGREALPLSEIFPDDNNYPVDVEYEFIDSVDETAQITAESEMKSAQAVATTIETENAALMNPIANIKSAVETKSTVPAEKVQVAVKQEPQKLVKATEISSNKDSIVQPIGSDVDLSKMSFTIQVASFKERSRAETKLSEIQKKGYKGFIMSKDLGAKGVWHRVYIGQYQTKAEADQSLSKVQQDYQSCFIISPK
ncbi:MAG: SPOR domain-containing protein [Candidatus Omnitrophica bacterium]|nr:SPOR domain-containing protein [Candidatus Omnitrophota bacterium]